MLNPPPTHTVICLRLCALCPPCAATLAELCTDHQSQSCTENQCLTTPPPLWERTLLRLCPAQPKFQLCFPTSPTQDRFSLLNFPRSQNQCLLILNRAERCSSLTTHYLWTSEFEGSLFCTLSPGCLVVGNWCSCKGTFDRTLK